MGRRRPGAARKQEASLDTLGTEFVDLRLQDLSVDRCNEPGIFLAAKPGGGFIRPRVLRVVFQDGTGEAVPVLSLAEITTP